MLRAVGEELRALLSGGDDEAGGVFGFVFNDVADGDDLSVGGEEVAEKGSAAAANSDETDAGFTLLEWNVGHGFAVGGKRRLLSEPLLNGAGDGCAGDSSLHEAAARPGIRFAILVVDCHRSPCALNWPRHMNFLQRAGYHSGCKRPSGADLGLPA